MVTKILLLSVTSVGALGLPTKPLNQRKCAILQFWKYSVKNFS